MVQRIRNVEMSCPIDYHRGRKIQQGLICRTTVAAETSGRLCSGRDITYGSTQVCLLGEDRRIDPAGFGKRILIHFISHRSGRSGFRSSFPHLDTACNRRDAIGLPVDFPNDVVLRVGDEEVFLYIEGETLRFIQMSGTSHSSITGPA